MSVRIFKFSLDCFLHFGGEATGADSDSFNRTFEVQLYSLQIWKLSSLSFSCDVAFLTISEFSSSS